MEPTMSGTTAEKTAKSGTKKAWLLFALGTLVTLGISYAAYTLANAAWAEVVDYRSPFTTMLDDGLVRDDTQPLPPIPDATPRRVVLVLIDGMTDAASRMMPSINALRARGSDVALTVPQPSLSYPTWTTILTGAPPNISGVTTNWYEGRVKVESLFDVAAASGRSVVVAGPSDLDELFGVSKIAKATAFRDWQEGDYATADIVDDALALSKAQSAEFVFALFPDVDEAGHAHGAASREYADVIAKVDADLERLITGLDDGKTIFVVLPDHGHLPTGGHGGWESPVIHTSATFAGPGVNTGSSAAKLQDVAPTIAVLAGLQTPRYAAGLASAAIIADSNGSSQDADFRHAVAFTIAYARIVDSHAVAVDQQSLATPAAIARSTSDAEAARLKSDRAGRLPLALGLVLAAIAVLGVIGVASWRALVAALAGSAVYFAVYNGLFFVAHHYAWSLSAFNEEARIQAFFNGRMLETVIAGLLGCIVAALVYLTLRPAPKGATGRFAAGWLSLGTATALTIQSLLGLQVAWFLWQWGAQNVWRLPDLKWGFKFDLDLIQMTAIAGVALLGPPVTYLVGRFHLRVASDRPS